MLIILTNLWLADRLHIIFIHLLWWNTTVFLILNRNKIYFDIAEDGELGFEIKYGLCEKSNSI